MTVHPDAPAPRDPAAGATPARKETLDAALEALRYCAAYGDTDLSVPFARLTPLEARALLAALRERDAAREDAGRLRETADALVSHMKHPFDMEVLTVRGREYLSLADLEPWRRTVSDLVDALGAARAATAGRTP